LLLVHNTGMVGQNRWTVKRFIPAR
jgi:hypothetical protein